MFENIKQQIKGAWNSWTIWFNSVGVVLLTLAMNEPMIMHYLEGEGFIIVLIIGNMILRFKTTQALGDKANAGSS